jgi:hypothetical protein
MFSLGHMLSITETIKEVIDLLNKCSTPPLPQKDIKWKLFDFLT